MAKSPDNYTSIYTDDETREALAMLAEKHGISRSAVVRQAVLMMATNESEIQSKVRELVKLTGA